MWRRFSVSGIETKHTSLSVKSQSKVFDWPTQSPDFTPKLLNGIKLKTSVDANRPPNVEDRETLCGTAPSL